MQTTQSRRKTPAPLWSSPVKTTDGQLLPSHGGKVCRWIEANAVYGEGDWAGEPVNLRDFQRRFLYRLYEFYPETGQRRFRRALLGMGKGNGKSPIAAWVGAYELAGGVQKSPRVIVGAASLKQANLVFGDLKAAMASPTLKPVVDPFELQVLLKDRPGLAERIAAEAGTNDGARATCFIPDELHEWEGRTARVYMIVDGAIAKRRNAFTFGISTAGVMGDGLLMGLYEHGMDVARGLVEDDAFLFEWYEARAGLDLDDEEQWLEAVYEANPAAGDFLDIDNVRHRFQTMPRFEFERYHLNRWTAAHNTWIPMEKWAECSGEPSIPEGSDVFVGIDGAAKRDTTAVYMVLRDDEGILHTIGRVFEPPEAEDESIDPELIKSHIRDIDRRYNVLSFTYDPHLFWQHAQQLLEEGLPMVELPQNFGAKVRYSQALYDVVLQGRLRHGGEKVLTSHAEAAVAKDRGTGWTLEKIKASRHIDAIVALAMAVQAAEEQEDFGEPGVAVYSF